jgi:hypothetical protein
MNDTTDDASDDRTIPPAALFLGAAGVIPFLLPAAALHFDLSEIAPWDRMIRGGLAAYAALIASFLGGIRWGVALQAPPDGRRTALFAVSVLPSLAAWGALALPRPHDLSLLIALFLGLAVADIRMATRGEVPRWFGTLRLALSIGAVGSLILAFAAPGA